MPKLRTYAPGDAELIEKGMGLLRVALRFFKRAKAVKTARRVRLAISSGKGAQRHVDILKFYFQNPGLRSRRNGLPAS
jgi:hypothetical protein